MNAICKYQIRSRRSVREDDVMMLASFWMMRWWWIKTENKYIFVNFLSIFQISDEWYWYSYNVILTHWQLTVEISVNNSLKDGRGHVDQLQLRPESAGGDSRAGEESQSQPHCLLQRSDQKYFGIFRNSFEGCFWGISLGSLLTSTGKVVVVWKSGNKVY